MRRLSHLIKFEVRKIKGRKNIGEQLNEIQGRNVDPLQNQEFLETAEYFKNSEFDQKLEAFLQQKMDQGVDMEKFMGDLIQKKLGEVQSIQSMSKSQQEEVLNDGLKTKEIDDIFNKDFGNLIANNEGFQNQIDQLKQSLDMPGQQQFEKQFENFQNLSIEEQKQMAGMGKGQKGLGGYKGIQKNSSSNKNKKK